MQRGVVTLLPAPVTVFQTVLSDAALCLVVECLVAANPEVAVLSGRVASTRRVVLYPAAGSLLRLVAIVEGLDVVDA